MVKGVNGRAGIDRGGREGEGRERENYMTAETAKIIGVLMIAFSLIGLFGKR